MNLTNNLTTRGSLVFVNKDVADYPKIDQIAGLLSDILFTVMQGGAIFNIQSLLINIYKVKVNVKESLLYFTEIEDKCMLITSEMTYFCEGDVYDASDALTNHFATTPTVQVIEFFEIIYLETRKKMSLLDKELENIRNVFTEELKEWMEHSTQWLSIDLRTLTLNTPSLRLEIQVRSPKSFSVWRYSVRQEKINSKEEKIPIEDARSFIKNILKFEVTL